MRTSTPWRLWGSVASSLLLSASCGSETAASGTNAQDVAAEPPPEAQPSSDTPNTGSGNLEAASPAANEEQPSAEPGGPSNEEPAAIDLPLSEQATDGELGLRPNPDEAPTGDDADFAPPLRPAPATVCSPGPFADSPLTAESTPTVVCDSMGFIEGPVWFANLNTLFFSDIAFGAQGNAGTIYRLSPGGTCEPFLEQAGTNGLLIAPDGNLLGMRHGDRTLTVFDLETREPTVLVADFEGDTLSGPNDAVLRSDGNLYFTDPNYGLGGGQSPLPPRAYRRDPQGNLSIIDSGANPNGISLSPAEDRLYVSHLGGGSQDVVVYPVNDDGTVGTQAPFLDFSSDGMTVDCAGNLYLTNGGVQIFSPEGQPLGTLDTPGAANVAFGGQDRRTLYVTATDRLYAVPMAIEGMPY